MAGRRLQAVCVMGMIAMVAAHGQAVAIEAFERRGDAIEDALGGKTGDVVRGRAIVLDRGLGNCLICHHVPVASEPFQGDIGPDLAGVGARLSAGQLRLLLVDQSLLNPETTMPPYYREQGLTRVAPVFAGTPILDAQQIEDVVAWLAALKETAR